MLACSWSCSYSKCSRPLKIRAADPVGVMGYKYRSTCIASFAIVLLTSLEAEGYMWRRQAPQEDPPGSTPNLKEIFIGRCYEHLQCLQTDTCARRPGKIDCEAVWTTFLNAFKSKDPCGTPEDAYDAVLEMAPPITPVDQTLFWSGLLDAALNVARVSMQYRILEESLPGYMANNLVWCGDPDSTDGINYETCPYNSDTCETSFRFWLTASRELAKQATGKVSVALNAHREGGAFRNSSVFATVELPSLNPETVTIVEILLVPNITEPDSEPEKCGEGSIKELQRRLDEAGLNWKCIYDPLEFRFIQCTTLEDPLAYKACRGGKDEALQTTIIIGASLGGVVLILFLILIVLCMVTRKNDEVEAAQEATIIVGSVLGGIILILVAMLIIVAICWKRE